VVSVALALASCGPSYSPNTYDTSAVQKANGVDQGVVIGVRPVDVSTDGATGAITGAAAGGIAGSQVSGGGATSALGALGGGLIGSLVGRSAEKVAGATTAFEYIIRKSDDKLISVTQQDVAPMKLGEHVLVIAGTQARIIPDYTVTLPDPPKPEKVDTVPPSAPIVAEPIVPSPQPPGAAPAEPPPSPPSSPAPTAAPTPLQSPPPSPPPPVVL
jgi:outer membrane lipoprotein SlyB